MRRLTLAIFVILSILLLDQSLKVWVKLNMYMGNYGKLLLSLFRIFAVGLLSWFLVRLIRERAHKGLIVALSMIIAGALGNIIDSAFYGLLFSGSFHSIATFLPESGGYAGFLYGSVVDMLYFPVYHGYLPQWMGGRYVELFRPIFNLADLAITFGVLSLIVFQRSFFAYLQSNPKPQIPNPQKR